MDDAFFGQNCPLSVRLSAETGFPSAVDVPESYSIDEFRYSRA